MTGNECEQSEQTNQRPFWLFKYLSHILFIFSCSVINRCQWNYSLILLICEGLIFQKAGGFEQTAVIYFIVFCRLPVFLQRFLLHFDLCVRRCFPPCVCVCLSVCISVCMCVCCRTGENKSPAVVLISSSFVSVLRDQLSALGLPLQLHLLPTIITPFNCNAPQTATRRV